jgi:hypothetical protein
LENYPPPRGKGRLAESVWWGNMKRAEIVKKRTEEDIETKYEK